VTPAEEAQGGIISVDPHLEKTAFGALHTEQYLPKRHYIWNKVNNGTALTATVPYSDIKYYDSGVNGLISENNNGLIRLSGLNVVEELTMRGSGYKYNPGQTLMSRFTGKFFQGAKDPGGTGCTIMYLGFGNYDNSNVVENFLGFGYGDDTLPYSQENFGVIYTDRGVRQFFPKTAWNKDKCDGTTSSLNITDWNKINVFQVELIYLGGGNIDYKIMDVNTETFVTVHRLELTGALTSTSLGDPNLGFGMHIHVTANSIPLLTTDSVECGSFGLFIEGESLREIDRGGVFNQATGITTEAHVLSVRNDTTFYSLVNHGSIDIDIITAAVDGTKNAIVAFYKNATLTTPVWTAVNANLFSVSSDTAGTYTLASGQLLWANALAKVDEITMTLTDIHIHLDPGDSLTITCQSASSTDCSASMGWHAN
jgi:hypothetical protein